MIMTIASNRNCYPNSREYFYLKLLENGADDLMSIDCVANLLGIKPRNVIQAITRDELTILPGIAIDQLATQLFRHPGFAPAWNEGKIPLPALSLEQLTHILTQTRQKLSEYPHLRLDEMSFAKAIATSLARNCGTDWQYATTLLIDRLIAKLSQN